MEKYWTIFADITNHTSFYYFSVTDSFQKFPPPASNPTVSSTPCPTLMRLTQLYLPKKALKMVGRTWKSVNCGCENPSLLLLIARPMENCVCKQQRFSAWNFLHAFLMAAIPPASFPVCIARGLKKKISTRALTSVASSFLEVWEKWKISAGYIMPPSKTAISVLCRLELVVSRSHLEAGKPRDFFKAL